ncbi:MAG: hypothetical protein IJX38_03840 [Clostridia bacterium]|nr:hypothetical protein [Clostridia bacterium]
MKKIFTVLCIIMALLLCLSVPCFAAEAEDVPEVPEVSTDTVPEAAPEEAETHTVFTRLWEFVNQYKGEVLTLIGDAALIIIAIYMKLRGGKGTKEINAALTKIKEETGLSLSNQGNVVDVINNLIDSYNAQAAEYARLKEAYEKYGATELDRNKVIGALAAEVATVLDILSTVYVNNKNLPQGVKDLVNIKYANCLKALENDGELASVVKAVRAAIGTGEDAGSAEEKVVPEDTEV